MSVIIQRVIKLRAYGFWNLLKNKFIVGIHIITLNNPLIWTIHLLQIVYDQHPEQFRFLESNFIDKLYGSDKLRLSILNEGGVIRIIDQFKLDEEEFLIKRKNYLIY